LAVGPRTDLRITLKGTVRTAKPHFSRGVTCSTSDTGMFGYIALHQPTQRSPLLWQIPPETPCIPMPYINTPTLNTRVALLTPYTPSQPWKLLRYSRIKPSIWGTRTM